MRIPCLLGITTVLLVSSGCERRNVPGGVTISVDSSGDTTIVRVEGTLPETDNRTLVERVRIAPGIGDGGLFTVPANVTIDRAGRTWVFDAPSNTIFLFGEDGRLIRRIGRRGGGPGEFESATGMAALADSGVAVWDPINSRITRFAPSGELRAVWSMTASLAPFQDLVTDATGRLYLTRAVDEHGRVIRALEQMVQELPPEGLFQVDSGGTVGDSLIPGGPRITPLRYVARDRGIRASYAAPNAPFGYWTLHPDGFVAVADGGRFEITLAPSGEKPTVIRRTGPDPVKVSPAEQEDDRAWISYNLRKTDPNWRWTGPELPATKAPLVGIHATRDGRIWARVAARAVPRAAGDVTPPVDPNEPIRHFRDAAVFEVFNRRGMLLGRVEGPAGFSLLDADGETVWGTVIDADDLTAVVRYGLSAPWRGSAGQ